MLLCLWTARRWPQTVFELIPASFMCGAKPLIRVPKALKDSQQAGTTNYTLSYMETFYLLCLLFCLCCKMSLLKLIVNFRFTERKRRKAHWFWPLQCQSEIKSSKSALKSERKTKMLTKIYFMIYIYIIGYQLIMKKSQ